MRIKYLFLLLIALGLISGCSKETHTKAAHKLYTQSLNQIKRSLKGSWDLRSVCTTSIVGSNCHDVNNESLIFSDDSLFWIKDNEITKKGKIKFIRIISPSGFNLETDSLYVFKFEQESIPYFPYNIIQDTLVIQDAFNAIDAGFQMTLTKSK